MNDRTVAWRNKPTQDIKDILEEAQQLKLYLLQETGPTSFVFKDENENKLRVSIGREVICSCSPSRKDHCIHTLYTLLKVFKIASENPLLWQGSYIDSEVADLIRLRYNPQTTQPKKVGNFLKRSTKPKLKTNTAGQQRQNLGDDDICPICHEDMKEEEGTTFCKKGCGNNFHFKCIMIWAQHRHNIGDLISCPMCRCDWGDRAYENLVREFEEFESRFILHKGHKCGACKNTTQKFIKGKLLHCVYCENFELCEKCFSGFEHYEHNRYLMKDNINDEWRPAPNREQIVWNQRNKDELDELIPNFQENPLSEKEIALQTFIISCFSNVTNDIHNNNAIHGGLGALSIIGHDMRKNCSYCHSDSIKFSKLKRIACGHVIHSKCLLEMAKSNVFKCPEEGFEFLKGYRTAFQNSNKVPNTTPAPKQKSQPLEESKKSNITNHPSGKPPRNRSTQIPKKLAPLELDIKGKKLADGNENNDEASSDFIIDSIRVYKSQATVTRQINKKHLMPLQKKPKDDQQLPLLAGIQGINLVRETKTTNQNNSRQPMQGDSPSSLIDMNRKSHTPINNFRISSNPIKVLPRQPRKAPMKMSTETLQINAQQIFNHE